jgi:hypothetical protein
MKKLSKYFALNSKEFILLITATLLYIFVFSLYPIRDADSGVWIPMAKDFFGSLDTNIGVHRPLFGFLAFTDALHSSRKLTTAMSPRKDAIISAVKPSVCAA